MEVGAAIVTLLSIILLALKQWQARKTKQETNSADINIQEMRKDLSKDNAAGVSAGLADQHDRVQQALRCDPSWGNYSGEQEPAGSDLQEQRGSVESAAELPE